MSEDREIAMPLIEAAASVYHVPAAAVLSRNRQTGPAYARFAVTYVLRFDHDWPVRRIGEVLGRGTSTISHQCGVARQILAMGSPTFERCVGRVRAVELVAPVETQTRLRRLPAWVPAPLVRSAA